MLKIYQKFENDKKIHVLRKPKPGSWICVENPSDSQIKKLSRDFKLEEDLIKDAMDIYEAPRLEQEKNNIYVFTTFPSSEKELDVTSNPVLIIINHDYIFTISSSEMPFVIKLINSDVNFSTADRQDLFLKLMQNIYSEFNIFMHKFTRKIRQKSVQLEKISNTDIVQFVNYESLLNDFLFDFIPASSVFNTLLSGKVISFKKDQKDILEDLMLSNGQLIEFARSNLKNMVNIREAYSTIMTNNLNRVIKTFTSLTVILAVPTMIASIYGMNVHLPFEQGAHAFGGIIALLLFISGFLVAIFFKKDWL